MISIRLNGENKDFPDTINLLELLKESRIPTQSVAVAINNEIIPQSEFGILRIRDQDHIEVIHAVGGG